MNLMHQIAVGVGIAALGYLIGLAVGILHERSKAARRDALTAAAEREACCKIVYGLCESDNVAQRTVNAIRARETPERLNNAASQSD
jgi:hypothetical protein